MKSQGPLYSTHYIHGTTPDEQRRLSRLNDLLNVRCIAEMAVQEGDRILDVGSGLGQFSSALAREAGARGAVVAVEGDLRQVAEARRLAAEDKESLRVDVREGDAYALPLGPNEWGTFDIAHARFVLEHVREPLKIVQQMARAVRNGGRVVLADDDHDLLRFWPPVPAGIALWQAYIRTYDILGNDPHIGRKLVSLLFEAELQPHRNTWLFFGSCQGHPRFQDYVSNLVNVLQGAREHMISQKLIAHDTFDDAVQDIVQWSRLPDAALWYGMSWAEGIRR
jgi:SAM-dependent methyltransferase